MLRGVPLLILALAAGGAQAAAPRLGLDRSVLDGGSHVVPSAEPRKAIRLGAARLRIRPAAVPVAPSSPGLRRPQGYGLTGDVHPRGDGLRVSLGLREDQNRRLLRGTADAVAPGSGRYAPLVSVGLAGQVVEGLTMAVDAGIVGQGGTSSDSVVITPVEQAAGAGVGSKGYRPLVQLSAGYRF